MTEVQRHRGPDDGGVWEKHLPDGEYLSLGSRRLAIIDLSEAGHMPMLNEAGDVVITYNGEIYNFQQLRRELQAKGDRFRSHTDTEVVLRLYEREGPGFVKRLNGMFAFAIVDLRQPEPLVMIARDHFGVKPFYYFHDGNRLAFASEAKALLELRQVNAEIDPHALQQYLAFLWVPDPLTVFKGIRKLPAGYYATFRGGAFKLTQYWDLQFPAADHNFSRSEAELSAELRERFSSAIRAQMVSDVPLGAFLSAGLDSSSILAAMVHHSPEPVRTFTIAFPEKYRRGEVVFDDTAVARRTAEYFGCKHTEILVEPDVVKLLPKLVWHMDEPTADPAIIAAYLVSREARKQVKVLLSGVGGDELFAGYRKYQAHYFAEKYRRIPESIRRNLLEPVAAILPLLRNTPFKGHVRLLKKMARSGSLAPRDRFIMDSTYLTTDDCQILYSDQTRAAINMEDPRIRHLEYFQTAGDFDFLNQMLYLDVKAFMVSLNLTYNDKMSMATSVEARVPFLDWEFAEWVAANVSPSQKLKGNKTKYILREAMRPLLPAEVLQQKKAGFAAPIDYWLANDLREMVADLLSASRLKARGVFHPETVARLVREHQSGQKDWAFQIWQLLTFELWMQTFVD
jgi:asparagine synthase (glutamine-hydrolysing)